MNEIPGWFRSIPKDPVTTILSSHVLNGIWSRRFFLLGRLGSLFHFHYSGEYLLDAGTNELQVDFRHKGEENERFHAHQWIISNSSRCCKTTHGVLCFLDQKTKTIEIIDNGAASCEVLDQICAHSEYAGYQSVRMVVGGEENSKIQCWEWCLFWMCFRPEAHSGPELLRGARKDKVDDLFRRFLVLFDLDQCEMSKAIIRLQSLDWQQSWCDARNGRFWGNDPAREDRIVRHQTRILLLIGDWTSLSEACFRHKGIVNFVDDQLLPSYAIDSNTGKIVSSARFHHQVFVPIPSSRLNNSDK